MIDLDGELAEEYLAESLRHVDNMEAALLSIGTRQGDMGGELLNRAFRAAHSVQGGAGVFELVRIGDLARRTEDALALIRSREMPPTPERVRVLLGATDRLRDLIQHPDTSNQADTTGPSRR